MTASTARILPDADGHTLDWPAIHAALDGQGYCTLPGLIAPQTCQALAALYAERALFRSRVVMARHHFGSGEYQYFRYPLPEAVARLRENVYPRLVPLANRWNEALGLAVRYPDALDAFLARCHQAGQTRPTPLLLHYRAGDYNCLHQDLYGEHVFPVQLAVLLSRPGVDFTGGEFVLTEQRPRMQSRADVVRWARATACCSPSTSGRYAARVGTTGSPCAMA